MERDPLWLPSDDIDVQHDADGKLLSIGPFKTMLGMMAQAAKEPKRLPSLRSALSGDKPYPTNGYKEVLYAELGRLNGLKYDSSMATRWLVPKAYRPRAPRFVPAEHIDPVTSILRTHLENGRMSLHARAFGISGKPRELGAYLVQPYMGWEGTGALEAIAQDLTFFGLCALTPPDPFASIYYPGYAVSLVICRPEIARNWRWVADQAEMRTEGNYPGRYAPLLTPRQPFSPPASWNAYHWPRDWYPQHSAWNDYGQTSVNQARYKPLKDATYV